MIGPCAFRGYIEMLIGSDRCVSRVRWSAACAVVLGAMASHASPLDSNVGRYRFATGSSVEGEAVGQFATDGKPGLRTVG